jgi:hypothetical protein
MWLAARRIETAEIREIVLSGYQEALAGAQRKISDYLLLCGGTPYVADGEPVARIRRVAHSRHRRGPDGPGPKGLDQLSSTQLVPHFAEFLSR